MKVKIDFLPILLALLLMSSYCSGQIVQGTSVADGAHSFAAGDSSWALGLVSIALGKNASAFGNYSTSIGQGTTAQGDNSFALGQETQAIGKNSFASGVYTQANGESSFASGFGSNATGNSSVALGVNTYTAPGADGAVALGGASQAFGDASFAAGQENITRSFGEAMLGLYGADYTPTSEVSNKVWFEKDRLFTIANGTSNTDRSNALVMTKDGDTDMIGNLTVSQRINIGDDLDSLVMDTLGDIRFNRANGDFEGYTSVGWQSLTANDITASRAASGEWVKSTNTKRFGNNFSQYLAAPNVSSLKGEAINNEYKDQIQVYDFDASIEGAITDVLGQFGQRGGHAPLPEFVLTKPVDRATTGIMLMVAQGTNVPDLILSWVVPTIGGERLFMRWTFKNTIFRSIDHFFDDDLTTELNRVKFVSEEIQIQYYKVNTKTGDAELANEVSWNYKQNSNR